ncbi:MAG: SRPBCC family protein [Thermaerobacter sp.]|nr:SRPBCC family protein [Thermaerobacter sp.]
MPYVEVTRVVKAKPSAVFAALSDMEAFPRFMENVNEVKVLKRDGNTTESSWHVTLQGAPFRWVEADVFLPDEGRITYRQLSGDLRKFEGEWRVVPAEEGTSVTLTTDFEFGMPMIAGLLNPVAKLILRRNAEQMLEALQADLNAG